VNGVADVGYVHTVSQNDSVIKIRRHTRLLGVHPAPRRYFALSLA
jgi:hypothetical protein